MGREYRLTAPGYHGAHYRERGAIVSLLPHERPGPHMIPARPKPVVAMPRAAPPVVTQGGAEPAVISEIAKQNQPVEVVLSTPIGYLIVDTETNGLADPRLASLALIFTDAELLVEHTMHVLIRPDGWEMPIEVASKIHGLTQERLEAEGVPIIGPLLAFAGAVALGRIVVAHNLPFDMRVLAAELLRANLPAPPKSGICTMDGARKAGAKGMLAAAHETLVGRPMDGEAHDALSDAMACLEILRALRRKEAA